MGHCSCQEDILGRWSAVMPVNDRGCAPEFVACGPKPPAAQAEPASGRLACGAVRVWSGSGV